jgi:hypothetical protein
VLHGFFAQRPCPRAGQCLKINFAYAYLPKSGAGKNWPAIDKSRRKMVAMDPKPAWFSFSADVSPANYEWGGYAQKKEHLRRGLQ